MHKIQVRNRTKALKKRLTLDYCEAYWCKLRGLAWRRKLEEEDGIVLVYKNVSIAGTTIHMFGMFFDLAVIWLGDDLKVVDIRSANKWRSIIAPTTGASYVIECSPSRISEFKIGDQIEFESV
jgi:uncharacterized membrane protein (UPF0127 family)